MFHCTIVDFHVLSPSYPRRVSKRGDKYYHFLFRYSAIVGDYLISRTHSNISWFARKLCQWIKQACPEGKNLKKVLNFYRNHSGNNFLAIFMIISAIVSAVASTRLILQACDDKVKIFRVLFTQINIWNFFSGKKSDNIWEGVCHFQFGQIFRACFTMEWGGILGIIAIFSPIV